MNLIFLGGSTFVIPIVETLNNLFSLSRVIVKKSSDPLIEFCKLNDIPFSVVKNSDELEIIISEIKPVAGITADFGMIIPEKILNLLPQGILNIHPSLLPELRGPTPAQTALLNGQLKTGVTLFKLDKEIDHGPIVAQDEFDIPEEFTSKDLLTALFKLGAKLIEDNLEDYINNDLIPVEQNHKLATYTKMFSKDDGFINLSNPPKKNLQNMINAFYPWPSVWTKFKLQDKEVIIKLLPHKEIQVEGKKPMEYKDFKNGYKNGEELIKKLKLN